MNITDALNSADSTDSTDNRDSMDSWMDGAIKETSSHDSAVSHADNHVSETINDNRLWAKGQRPFGCSQPDALHLALEAVFLKLVAESRAAELEAKKDDIHHVSSTPLVDREGLAPVGLTTERLSLIDNLISLEFRPVWLLLKTPLAVDNTIVAFRRILAHIVVENGGDITSVFKTVHDLWDLAIVAGQQGLADDVIAFKLIHDLLNYMTVDCTDLLFSYLDSRVEIMTNGMASERGRGLFLLRLCNDFLRRMSKSKHNVVCGKLLTLVSNTYPLSERSGVNVRGEYNLGNMTVFEPAAFPMDTNMSGNSVSALSSQQGKSIFYESFWGLQEFFSNPTLLFDATRFNSLQMGMEKVVKVLEDIQNESDQSSGSDRDRRKHNEKRGRPHATTDIKNDYFFPKFLTSPTLFDLELNDPFFRRQILVQIMIVFQFLANLSAGEKEKMAKQFAEKGQAMNRAVQYAYVLTPDQESWVADCRSRSFKVLEKISPHGKLFSKTLLTVLMHEKNWLKWKLESCTSYEKPAVELGPIGKHQRVEASAATNKAWLGNEELTLLWERGRDLNQVLLFKSSRSVVPTLDVHLQDLDYQLEDDCETLAEGIEDESYAHYNNMRYNWIAYRTAIKSHIHLFSKKEPRSEVTRGIDPKAPKSAAKTLVIELLRDWRDARTKKLATHSLPAHENDCSGSAADPTLKQEGMDSGDTVEKSETDESPAPMDNPLLLEADVQSMTTTQSKSPNEVKYQHLHDTEIPSSELNSSSTGEAHRAGIEQSGVDTLNVPGILSTGVSLNLIPLLKRPADISSDDGGQSGEPPSKKNRSNAINE